MSLALRFFQAREARGLTQRELAARVGMSQQWAADIESGKMAPSAHRARQLAAELGVTVEWLLLGETDER